MWGRRDASGRSHHMFHRVSAPWNPRNVELATTTAYILGMGFVSCMFAVMSTDLDEQGKLWFSSGGIAVIAMLLAVALRSMFDDMLCGRLLYRQHERESGTGMRGHARFGSQFHSQVSSGAYARVPAIMPRLTLLELLRDA
jgi:hypothetical protein